MISMINLSKKKKNIKKQKFDDKPISKDNKNKPLHKENDKKKLQWTFEKNLVLLNTQ